VRIALATVGTTGDVVPFIELAEGLLAAEHEVTAVSWELYRSSFEEAGARFEAAGPPTTTADIADTAARAAAAGSPMAQVGVLRDFHLRDAAAHHAALRERLVGHDLVLLHGIHTLAEAAVRDAGVAYATAVFDPVLLPTATAPPAGMPSLGPFNRLGWRMVDGMLRRQDGPLHQALRKTGSASARQVTMFRARSPRLHLVAVSPAIAPPPSDLDPSTHFTGAWQRQGPPDALPNDIEAFLDAGDPPLVVTFGSMAVPDAAAVLAAVMTGIRQAGQRAVVQDGSDGAAASDGVLRTGRADHRALFPRAAGIIHHGGAGTTHAAVVAGKASVVVPHVGDQPFWANRLRRLGVAPAPLKIAEVTAQAVAERVGQATSASIRSAAADLGPRVAAERGVDRAVQLLEQAVR
jgi:sterol 3beta-glucosyltransferase/vancomycin aglycone glucosyltransferase